MAYKKIHVLADELTFEKGARLGLDSRQAAVHRDYVAQLKANEKPVEGEFDVVTPITFNKGSTLWVEEKSLPKLDSVKPEYRIVPMIKTYNAV